MSLLSIALPVAGCMKLTESCHICVSVAAFEGRR